MFFITFKIIKSFSFFQEQALLDTGETKYKHLEEDLHVEISTYGPPAEVSLHLKIST